MSGKVTMTSQEYEALSNKIDRFSEKIGEQFTRFEDVKLSKSEYEHAHEALVLRVNAIEQKMDAESKASDAEHLRIETASATRYDKTDAKIEVLNTKIDTLKYTVNTRFDTLRDQTASTRRGWVQFTIGTLAGILGGGGIGSIVLYLTHLPH